MWSRWAISAPTRPRLSHTPRRIFSISAGDFSRGRRPQIGLADAVLPQQRPDRAHHGAGRIADTDAIEAVNGAEQRGGASARRAHGPPTWLGKRPQTCERFQRGAMRRGQPAQKFTMTLPNT